MYKHFIFKLRLVKSFIVIKAVSKSFLYTDNCTSDLSHLQQTTIKSYQVRKL